MAFCIEQDKGKTRLAYSLQSRADIESIRLLGASIVCKSRVEEVVFPLSFGLNYAAESMTLNGGRLTVPVRFAFRATTKEEIEAVNIRCTFQADYQLVEGYEPTSEEINAFSEGNAIFNCWPYFREFVQAVLARMRYPALSIPFLRLVPKASEGENQQPQLEKSEQRALNAPQEDQHVSPVAADGDEVKHTGGHQSKELRRRKRRKKAE